MNKKLASIEQYRKVSIVINVLGIGTASLFFWRNAPAWFVILVMVLPPLTMIIVKISRGVIHFNYRETTPNPSVGLVIIVCSIALTVYVVTHFNMLDYGKLWTHVLWVTVVVWILFLASTSEFNYRYSLDMANAISFCLFLIMYAFGMYTISNCLFDTAPPDKLTTTVSNKYIVESMRHNHTYFLTIEGVGPIKKNSIEVAEDVYNDTKTDQNIEVLIKKGRWGEAWYYTQIEQ
jgi:hypothetical protein